MRLRDHDRKIEDRGKKEIDRYSVNMRKRKREHRKKGEQRKKKGKGKTLTLTIDFVSNEMLEL